MSDQETISLETYCSYYNIELDFLQSLEEYGLLHIRYQESKGFIHQDDLVQLEQYMRMYYDLSINVPGIEALHHLLERLKKLQEESDTLRARLKRYE